jgi:hypothetical protein
MSSEGDALQTYRECDTRSTQHETRTSYLSPSWCVTRVASFQDRKGQTAIPTEGGDGPRWGERVCAGNPSEIFRPSPPRWVRRLRQQTFDHPKSLCYRAQRYREMNMMDQ